MEWRITIFQAIKNVNNSAQNQNVNAVAMLHDTPWSILALVTAARKKGFFLSSNTLLGRLRNSTTMDVVDIYTKVRRGHKPRTVIVVIVVNSVQFLSFSSSFYFVYCL